MKNLRYWNLNDIAGYWYHRWFRAKERANKWEREYWKVYTDYGFEMQHTEKLSNIATYWKTLFFVLAFGFIVFLIFK